MITYLEVNWPINQGQSFKWAAILDLRVTSLKYFKPNPPLPFCNVDRIPTRHATIPRGLFLGEVVPPKRRWFPFCRSTAKPNEPEMANSKRKQRWVDIINRWGCLEPPTADIHSQISQESEGTSPHRDKPSSVWQVTSWGLRSPTKIAVLQLGGRGAVHPLRRARQASELARVSTTMTELAATIPQGKLKKKLKLGSPQMPLKRGIWKGCGSNIRKHQHPGRWKQARKFFRSVPTPAKSPGLRQGLPVEGVNAWHWLLQANTSHLAKISKGEFHLWRLRETKAFALFHPNTCP